MSYPPHALLYSKQHNTKFQVVVFSRLSYSRPFIRKSIILHQLAIWAISVKSFKPFKCLFCYPRLPLKVRLTNGESFKTCPRIFEQILKIVGFLQCSCFLSFALSIRSLRKDNRQYIKSNGQNKPSLEYSPSAICKAIYTLIISEKVRLCYITHYKDIHDKDFSMTCEQL